MKQQFTLFDDTQPQPINVLADDGNVLYFGQVFNHQMATQYFEALLTQTPWKHDEAIINGKHIITPRLIAWYGAEAFGYTYSGTTKVALPWTPVLLHIKQQVEQLTQTTYNSCLLNLYPTGDVGMGWHSDGDGFLEPHSSIASVSFGATRVFAFKHLQSNVQTKIKLNHGSVLEMKGHTQSLYHHAILKSTKVDGARINLTFRQIKPRSV